MQNQPPNPENAKTHIWVFTYLRELFVADTRKYISDIAKT